MKDGRVSGDTGRVHRPSGRLWNRARSAQAFGLAVLREGRKTARVASGGSILEKSRALGVQDPGGAERRLAGRMALREKTGHCAGVGRTCWHRPCRRLARSRPGFPFAKYPRRRLRRGLLRSSRKRARQRTCAQALILKAAPTRKAAKGRGPEGPLCSHKGKGITPHHRGCGHSRPQRGFRLRTGAGSSSA